MYGLKVRAVSLLLVDVMQMLKLYLVLGVGLRLSRVLSLDGG
jgi:hypothetical protein